MVNMEDLTRPLCGWGIKKLQVKIEPAQEGPSMMFFTVLLSDEEWASQFNKPSEALGKKLNAISSRLRDRAIRANFPGFASIKFLLESQA